ncbi:MAG: response regulator [Pseudomonadota bacterium]|nr:response regulator [Pseudomonadota bacterium]
MTADFPDGKSEPAIYVVDDDPAVARTVARIGRSIGLDAQTFDSAAALLDALDHLGQGCVVLDIQMPGTSGIELLRILAERRPTWPVIMLTAYAEVGSAIDAFRGGAIHFLRKPFTRKQLVDALDEAAEVACDRMRRAVEPGQLAALKQLTPREREVLDALADGQQSKAIAWKLGISTRTVELHRSNILSKLSARNTSQAVAIARSASVERKPH